MSIRARIRAFQFLVAFAVLAMALTTLVGIRSSGETINRVQLSRLQLDAVTSLAIHANRFSEQIAELLLIGQPERPDFTSARSETAAAFEVLRQLISEELNLVRNTEEEAAEREEQERFDRMQALFREIDRAVERALLLDQQGQRDEAIALFRSEIENRLDADFEKLIAAAVADEREEVDRVQSEGATLSRRLTIATLALSAILLVITIGSGLMFARSLRTPINALAEGALAIERGELDHRIAYKGRDELGLLAARFNAMAAEIQLQRQALLDARSDLERQVAERTGEIRDANRQLTELDQQRARFLADASHELRTPLTIIRGEAEVTLRGASKPAAVYQGALSLIADQAADMSRLVDDLLFLARSEADEIRFEFRRIALSDLVSEAVEEAAALSRDRRIGFAIDPSEENPVVRADPRRLKQALLIVLDNAGRYGDPDTGVRVRIGVANGDAEIRVRDRGMGVPPDEVERVFDRFYRGSNARTKAGSGLGLPIARWIVEKHDGRIDLSGEAGGGTEVRIALPKE